MYKKCYGMASFAEQMVEKYEAALLAAPPGVRSVSVDGQSISVDDLAKGLQYWNTQVGRENGTRPLCAQISLTGLIE